VKQKHKGRRWLLILAAVSSITWLENNIFLMVHTPTTFDPGVIPIPTFHLVTRQPPSSHIFQKLADPSPPFGMNRSPPHHFMLRLKELPPNIQDLVVVSSTASIDIGLFTRSKTPLSKDVAAEKITNIFTMTGMANDSRRASLPMTEDMSDTSPIGLAFDLSAKEKVQRPIAGEDMNESATPLPALVVLNNEGILAGWWIVYLEAVRQGIAYPGLTAAGAGQRPQIGQPKPSFGAPAQLTTTFGQSALTSPVTASNAFSTPNNSVSPAFGTPSVPGTLGGNRGSLWGTPPTGSATPQTGGPVFGRPAFGSSTPLGGGGGFGAVGALGTNRSSPWAAAAAGTTPATGATFGQTSSFGVPAASPGSTATKPLGASSSGFGSWANQGGFAAAAAQSSTGSGNFGNGSPFATGAFGGGTDTASSFGTPVTNNTGTLGASNFKLVSTFKPDNAGKDDGPKPGDQGGSLFGASFGSTLTQTQNKPSTTDTREEDMDIENVSNQKTDVTGPSQSPQPFYTTRTSTPPVLKVSTSGTVATVSAAVESKSGSDISLTTSNKAKAAPPVPPAPFPPSPTIKSEPKEELGIDADLLEAPLPPDPTSKTTFQAGDSSGSSSFKSIDEPPLPPDFIAPKLSPGWIPPTDVPRGPSEEEGPLPPTSEGEISRFDDEGSGEDVAQDLSPITDRNDSRGITPQSSFAHSTFSKESSFDESPVGGQFSIVPRQYQPQQPSLFGEVTKPVPYLPPPTSRLPQSPRSPSPVRSGAPGNILRPDTLRSISSPIPRLSETRLAVIGPALHRAPAKQSLEDKEEELTDREDEKIRAELATEVKGTTVLAPFIAHQDYVGDSTKRGVPGQIEKVYRDINSMIDTLGLNARSLEAFIKGHSYHKEDSERTKDDLETDENWTFSEIEDLMAIEDDLSDRLEDSRIQDWRAQCRICAELENGLVKSTTLRSR
jgi:nucleoporin NUP159